MMRTEPAAVIGVVSALVVAAARVYLDMELDETAAHVVSVLLVSILIRQKVFCPRTHERQAGTGCDEGGQRSAGEAAALLCLACAGLVAACSPPVPLDSAEQLRQAREEGGAEVMGMALACLESHELETERAVLTCIFGEAAVADAPDRSPSRTDQLLDRGVDAVDGILGALGRRGAAEIEER